ncbi:hypothetical protein NB311A_20051 [Nitrobacter sp. Nb-311A]|nr:hypothetical protein NB311A_20051 [Nitrobacter sp. Nb-311A]
MDRMRRMHCVQFIDERGTDFNRHVSIMPIVRTGVIEHPNAKNMISMAISLS